MEHLRLLAVGAVAASAAMICPEQSRAAESAAGAYLLGLRAAGAGITPPEGLFFSNQTLIYRGRISGQIPFGNGGVSANGRIAPVVNVPTLLWITPVELGGVRLGMSLTVPFGKMSVRGSVGPQLLKDQTFRVGDPSVGAFLGGRIVTASLGQFHWQAGVTGFLPVGDYRRGEIANISKNRGALDVYGALTWIDPWLGLDVSNTVGVTFNRTNGATDYKTGDEFHWEWAVTKKFENGVSLGAVGYSYLQLTPDTGRGAALGAFKGRVSAIGATVGYDFTVGKAPISTKIRYYHEIDEARRLRGNAVFLSFSMPLWVPGAP